MGEEMTSTEFENLLHRTDRKIESCEPKMVEYWRGYRSGIRFHFQNAVAESSPDHYTLMYATTRRNGGDYVYVDAYARGFRDGCEGLKPEDIG